MEEYNLPKTLDPSPKAQLVRRVHFSSAHRYFAPELSEDENRSTFGLCYSQHGHGHNYILDAHFQGPIDPITGMIINLADVDQILKQVTNALDHHHLNQDVPEFKDKVPTTENIACYLYNKIQQALQVRPGIELSRVRLYEADDLWVDYGKLNSL